MLKSPKKILIKLHHVPFVLSKRALPLCIERECSKLDKLTQLTSCVVYFSSGQLVSNAELSRYKENNSSNFRKQYRVVHSPLKIIIMLFSMSCTLESKAKYRNSTLSEKNNLRLSTSREQDQNKLVRSTSTKSVYLNLQSILKCIKNASEERN